MKIAFLAGHNSIHTVKWVNEMASRGHEIHLLTMHPGTEELHKNIRVYNLPFKQPVGYYMNLWKAKKLLKQIQPDILNTHYASGYGTLARLSGFQPNLLSVWGSDVFDFPLKSKLNMRIMQKNLKAADRVASTSHIMKRQIESIYKPDKHITVIPFGVDCRFFQPLKAGKDNDKVVVGTVKSMAPKYGIVTLIESFALVKDRTEQELELVLVGGGLQEKELKLLTKKLGIDTNVKFVGAVPHHEVPKWLNSFDIYVALSIDESFGVAIVEASACEVPVVVSDAGGLLEVTEDGITGYIVPRNNPEKAADKLEMLINNERLRSTMGRAGREFVLKNYEWRENADRMENLYKEVIKEYKKRY